MSRILIFMAGALVGTGCTFLFGLMLRPEPAIERLANCPRPMQDAAVVTVQDCDTHPAPDETVLPAPPPAAVDQETPPLAGEPLAVMDPETPPLAGEPPAQAIPAPPPGLLIPVQGIEASQLSDTFTDSRGSGRVHDAIDIIAARGTPVVAVEDGRVVKLFDSVRGGLTVYQFDPTETFAYYYAHLDRYASGVVEGRQLKRGDVVGYVGSTGNASSTAPHLHFAIFVLGPEKRWWEGTAINPYPFFTARHRTDEP